MTQYLQTKEGKNPLEDTIFDKREKQLDVLVVSKEDLIKESVKASIEEMGEKGGISYFKIKDQVVYIVLEIQNDAYT